MTKNKNPDGLKGSAKKFNLTWEKIAIWLFGLLITGIGFEGKNIFNRLDTLEKCVGKLENKISNIEGKLDVLVAQSTAENFTSNKLQAALITSSPFQNDSGKWKMKIRVFDADSAQIRTYIANLEGKDDPHWINAVETTVRKIDTSAKSFSTMVKYSKQINQDISIPANINMDRSYIILKNTDIHNTFDSLLGKPTIIKVSFKDGNWQEFVPALSKKDGDFTSDIK